MDVPMNDDDEFRLIPPAPPRPVTRFENDGYNRQRLLIPDAMDLPGQMSLWPDAFDAPIQQPRRD